MFFEQLSDSPHVNLREASRTNQTSTPSLRTDPPGEGQGETHKPDPHRSNFFKNIHTDGTDGHQCLKRPVIKMKHLFFFFFLNSCRTCQTEKCCGSIEQLPDWAPHGNSRNFNFLKHLWFYSITFWIFYGFIFLLQLRSLAFLMNRCFHFWMFHAFIVFDFIFEYFMDSYHFQIIFFSIF